MVGRTDESRGASCGVTAEAGAAAAAGHSAPFHRQSQRRVSGRKSDIVVNGCLSPLGGGGGGLATFSARREELKSTAECGVGTWGGGVTVKSVDFQITACCGTLESRAMNALLMGFFCCCCCRQVSSWRRTLDYFHDGAANI